MSDMESRIGVLPLEDLLEERAALVIQVADQRAKFGPFGTADALRKIELARLKMLIRAQFTAAGTKITEAQLDDEAHAHPDYVHFVTIYTRDRAEWVRTEAAIEAVDFRIQRGQALVRFASAEVRL